MRRRAPWRMLLPALAAVLLWLAWSGYWLFVFETAHAKYREIEARLAASGLSLACSRQDWGGYPFRIEIGCADPQFTDGNGHPIASARAAKLLLIMQAYDIRRYAGLLDGPTQIKLGGSRPEMAIAHGRALAALRLPADGNLQFSVELPSPQIAGLGQAITASAHLRIRSRDTADVALVAKGLHAELPGGPAGRSIELDDLFIQTSLPLAVLDSPDPPGFAHGHDPALTISALTLRRGGLIVNGSGILSLDSDGRLNGRIATKASNLMGLLDVIRRAIGLREADVAAAQPMLSLLAEHQNGSIDLVVSKGALYWGPFKLADIPPWQR